MISAILSEFHSFLRSHMGEPPARPFGSGAMVGHGMPCPYGELIRWAELRT